MSYQPQDNCYPMEGAAWGEGGDDVDRTVYDRALEVGDPQFVEDDVDDPCIGQTVKRKVVRQVTVPFTRKVKVPVKTTKVVPCMEERRVRTSRLVEVPCMTMVDEEYTEIEERSAVRDKEIWVKKIVPETYIERVPVKKTRQVQKPSVEIREVEDWAVVQVPSSRRVEVDGFRVDEVEDNKMVEVEEFQEFELRPVATGNSYMYKTTDLGRVGSSQVGHLARATGETVYHPRDQSLRNIDEDSNPEGGAAAYAGAATGRSGGYRFPSAMRQSGAVANSRPLQAVNARGMNAAAAMAMTDPCAPGASMSAGNEAPLRPGQLGVVVMNTHTRHTDGQGVVVHKINKGGPAEAAGLQVNDIITSVHNQPTATVADFRNVVSRVQGPLRLQVNRDGRRNIKITIYRSAN